jgi:hypothetical protein
MKTIKSRDPEINSNVEVKNITPTKCWMCEAVIAETSLMIPKVTISDGKKTDIFPLCFICAKNLSKIHHSIQRLIRGV